MTSIGPGGYPDGQRVTNWDGPILLNHDTGLTALTYTSPMLNVSRYGFLAGQLICGAGPIWLQAKWFMDQAGTIQVGEQDFLMGTQVIGPARINLYNQGPYCQIVAHNPGAGNYRLIAVLFGTNRQHPLSFLPVDPAPLIGEVNQAIAGSGSVDLFPNSYFAGPIRVNFIASVTPAWLTLSSYDSTGVPRQIDLLQPPAASTWDTTTMQAPPGLWVVEVVNGTAGGMTYSLGVSIAPTGST